MAQPSHLYSPYSPRRLIAAIAVMLTIALVISMTILVLRLQKGANGSTPQKDVDQINDYGPTDTASARQPSQLPPGTPTGPAGASSPQGRDNPHSIDMKLLVIAADGKETDFASIKASLDRIGIPYDTLLATQTPLQASKLWDGAAHAYYQGIILTTGNLTYDKGGGQWTSAFTEDEWQTLWQYEARFGVRQVTSYTYPGGSPDYGLRLVAQQDTAAVPLQATLTPEGKKLFGYLNPDSLLDIRQSWAYLATITDPTVTTPLLVTSQGNAIVSIHKYPDGRENLAVTVGNNPDLLHSMLLSYGIINWVTKGIFLGERHVNLDIQIDDILIGDMAWDTTALTDTTGLTYRMTGNDLDALVAWQRNLQKSTANASTVALDMVFVGRGATGMYDPDTLTPAVLANRDSFNWVNHTYSHATLDTLTYDEALAQLNQNHEFALSRLGLKRYYRDAMVQPSVSGLSSPEALRAAHDFGIKYLISDTSRPGWDNPSSNAGLYSTFQPDVLIIPRRAVKLYYNVSTPAEWVSEYNCYYGPKGTCVGGTWRYWDHDFTYPEILDAESDILVRYLLKGELDPWMFHQPNLRAYDGTHSLLGDLVNATLTKYNRLYSLPVRNLTQHEVGIHMTDRMAYNAAGVRATIIPCTSITLEASKPVLVPVTGLAYGNDRDVYGGQDISYIQLKANQTVTVPAPACR